MLKVLPVVRSLSALFVFFACSVASAQKAPTTTALAITSSGSPVSSVAFNTPLTLTATVSATGNTTRGEVRFCDTAIHATCGGPAILGVGQIRPNGTARIVVRLSYGAHSIKAIYSGINTLEGSSSAASSITVTGTPTVTTSITATGGSGGNYTLDGKLTGMFAQRLVPAGPLQFVDSSYGNRTMATASLAITAETLNTLGDAFIQPLDGQNTSTPAVADFNNDGLQEVLFGCGGRPKTSPAEVCSSSEEAGSAVAADVNRDGNMDFVFTEAGSLSFKTTVAYGNGDGTFQSPVVIQHPDATQPGPMLMGDFDGDGFIDFVGGDYALWGNGDGTFQNGDLLETNGSKVPSPIYFNVYSVDLNGDGCADVLTETGVYYGSPARTFTPATGPGINIIFGDFNNDGKIDYVSSDSSSTVTYLGNGDGTFQTGPSSPVSLGNGAGRLVGDFNGDGNLDLAYVGILQPNLGSQVRVNVTPYFGDGAGAFRQGASFLGASVSQSTSDSYVLAGAADLNGDGVTDIGAFAGGTAILSVTTEWTAEKTNASAPEAGDHQIKAFIPASGIFPDLTSSNYATIQGAGSSSGSGGAGGTQATSTTLSVTSGGTPVTTVAAGTTVTLSATVTSSLAGLNGNVRFCDLAVSASCQGSAWLGTVQLTSGGAASISSVLSPGVHSLQAQYQGTTTYAISNSAAASLTVSPSTTSNSLSLNSSGVAGNYTLNAAVSFVSGPAPTGTVEFQDTSNSNQVIATATFDAATTQIYSKPATPNPGGGDSLIKDPDGIWRGIKTRGDFNRDGKIDYISGNLDDKAYLFLGNGNGTFQTPILIAGLPSGNVVGDFDGDGYLDVAGAASNGGAGTYPLNTIMVAYGHGDGTFGTPVSVGTASSLDAAADMNNDGIDDLLTGYTVYLGSSSRTFSQVTSTPTLNGLTGAFAAVADVNGDGRFDIVRYSTSADTHPVWVHLGNGDGTFGDPIVLTAELPIYAKYNFYQGAMLPPVVADFDGDGKADIMLLDEYYATRDNAIFDSSMAGELRFFAGKGDGTFDDPVSAASSISISPFGPLLSAQDVDGDGYLDMVASGEANSVLSSYFVVQHTYTAAATGIALSGAGNHLVKAVYAGDERYTARSSSTVTLQGGGTVPFVGLNVAPATGTSYGSNLILHVVLSGTGLDASATNGESIQFLAGTTSLGSVQLLNGFADLTINTLDPGSYALTAKYAGDSALQPSTSQVKNITITKATPVITWAQPSSITYGTALGSTQLNATANSSGGTSLAGTFTYLPAAGTVLDPGTQTLSVHFVPTDSSHYVETDGSVNIVVIKVASTATLSGPSTAQPNTPVTFTATVQGSGSAPTGQVTLLEDTTVLTSATLASGTANLTHTFTGGGEHILTLQYAGDAHYLAATSSFIITVQNTQPVITWNNPAPITYNAPLTSAQLNATAKTPGGQNLAGTFAYTPSAGNVLTPGTQTLSVVFTPSDNTYAVATKSVSIVVNKAPSSTAIVQTSPVSVGVGTSVNTTFTASATSLAGTPTGQVTFFDGSTQLGSATLVNGSAQFTTSFSGIGVHPITATYSGDTTFLGSTSPVFVETVVAPGLSIVANPSSMTIHQGSTGTSTIKLTPTGNYTGKIDFACSGLPSLATCTFSPSSIVMNGDNTVQTTTLSISTTGPNMGALRSNNRSGLQWAAMLGLPFVLFGFSRRKRTAFQTWLTMFVCALLAGSMIGCGTPDSVTPTGTTSVQVTAQASASAGSSAHNESVKIDITIVP